MDNENLVLRWSDQDYPDMGWHDASVHSLYIAVEKFQLVLDIDYILEWQQPGPGELYYRFKVCPCHLIFHDVHNLVLDWHGRDDEQILEISRVETLDTLHSRPFFTWEIQMVSSSITLTSSRFEQNAYKEPIDTPSQRLSR